MEDNLLEEVKLELIQTSKLSDLCYLMQKRLGGVTERGEREAQSLKKRLDLVSVFFRYILLTFFRNRKYNLKLIIAIQTLQLPNQYHKIHVLFFHSGHIKDPSWTKNYVKY